MIAPLPHRSTIAPATDKPRAMAPDAPQRPRGESPPRPPYLSL